VTVLFRVVPKVGPFKSLKITTPTPEVEKLFMASFNATVDRYRALLAKVNRAGIELPNENFDIGAPTRAGQYLGADEAYEKLVGKLADHQFAGLPPGLRENILLFYKGQPPISSPKERAARTKLLEELSRLQAVATTAP
jgi:hypothetical protein